ncbi:MAG TPA: hypothetical protein VKU60_06555 [Chloroflexota bacterium]|nr:hypothetical protein [Chloroflexota bacterium]
MAVEIEQRTLELRAKERLLVDGLAEVRGEQRRVQTALLRDTRRELALAGQAGRTLEAGYEPFEPAADWHWGYVEDPRLLRGRTRLLSAVVALPLAALAGTWLALRWELLATIVTAAVLWLGLQATVHAALGLVAQDRERRRLGGLDELRIFNAPMPAHAATAYRRAQGCGLFETFAVHSPRAEDFRSVSAAEAPSLGLLDPVLVGIIGEQRFLIAQWDLAEDLQGSSLLKQP